MGNINFNISKFVDLNKVVTLDIDKDVTVNVNNPDLLATAEADAEAFGTNALAEVDVYTFVEGKTNGDIGTVSLHGSVVSFDNVQPGDDFVILLSTSNGVLPDLDDIDASGVLAGMDGIPNGRRDIPLPVFDITSAGLEFKQDLSLTFVGPVGGGIFRYEGSNVEVNFGIRPVDLNNNGTIEAGETGQLTLNIFDALYDIRFALGVEVTHAECHSFWEFDTDGDLIPDITRDEPITFTITSLAGLATWDLKAQWSETVGGSQAFAYAKSTAALDLVI